MFKHTLGKSFNKLRQSARKKAATEPSQSQPTDAPSRIASVALFAREIIRNPRAMGAAVPSSAKLARAMAAQVPLVEDGGLVVEVGAGTGVVTAALLQRGILPENLIVVERAPALVMHLRQHFPHLRVIEGDAGHLKSLLGADFHRVKTIVSGLPLRSLPRPVVESIIRQYDKILENGGLLIQFTYDLLNRAKSIGMEKHFVRIASIIIWRNLPPARVEVFSHRNPRS